MYKGGVGRDRQSAPLFSGAGTLFGFGLATEFVREATGTELVLDGPDGPPTAAEGPLTAPQWPSTAAQGPCRAYF